MKKIKLELISIMGILWKSRLLKIMKLSLIICLVAFSQIFAGTGYSQSTRLSLQLKNATIREILETIENQSEFFFMYNGSIIDVNQRVSVKADNALINDLLNQILSGTGISYKIDNRQIALTAVNSAQVKQNKSVKGQVMTVAGEPIPGVTVLIKGTVVGTTTDGDGKYSLDNVSPEAILIFSFVGMRIQEELVAGKSQINIVLEDEAIGIEEVVAIGYGTMTKKDLTGSVGKLTTTDIGKTNVASYSEALAGRIAGVQVSSLSGRPGEDSDIVIRGGNSLTQSNAPLYVIDGFPMPEDYNNTLNPNDIESIDVLKDASATAIYGARGANGVIMITTKNGKSGKASISYDGTFGFSRTSKKMEILSPYQFALLAKELDQWDTKAFAENYLFSGIGRTVDDYKDVQVIDWQDHLLRDAPFQNHALTLTGGNEQMKYRVSGSFVDQQGIIIASAFKRYTGSIKLEQTFSKNVKLGLDVNYSNSVTSGSSPNVSTSSTNALFYEVWSLRPFDIPGGDMLHEDVDPLIKDPLDKRFNPITSANNKLNDNATAVLRGGLFLEVKILPELKLKVTGSLNHKADKRDVFNSSKTRDGNLTFSSGPNGSITIGNALDWNNENILSYIKTFKKDHRINAVVGFTNTGNRRTGYTFGSTILPNETLGLSGLEEGTPRTVSSASGEWRLMSFLGRINYNYKSRYMVTASYRADGSSKFPVNNRWGYFPSAAAAWSISEEPFMKPVNKILSNAKLRLSWGLTGNNSVGDFDYLAQTTMNDGSRLLLYPFGGDTSIQGSVISSLPNGNLKWETTEQIDFGMDLGFFRNRILLELDYYDKTTRDLLLNKVLPYTTGFSSSRMNIGSVKNSGFEFTINTINIKNKSFEWRSNFNISFNKGEIVALSGDEQMLTSTISWSGGNIDLAPAYVAKIGNEPSMMYGYIYDGLYQIEDFNVVNSKYELKSNLPTNTQPRANIQPGFIKYKDINGDGEVNADDRTIIGNANPLHYGGFNNSFKYKNLDLNMMLQWSYGNDIFNGNKYVMWSAYRANTNYFKVVEDRWTPENPDTDVPGAHSMYGHDAYSSWFVEDGSYLRLKSVQLGYTLPKTIMADVFSSFRVNLTANNLYTWSNYSGYDPEVSSKHSTLTRGFDFSSYPRAFTLTAGINITLK